jgi:hypothetical protein
MVECAQNMPAPAAVDCREKSVSIKEALHKKALIYSSYRRRPVSSAFV